MELISDYNILKKKFTDLLNRYDNYEWSVAWAGDAKSFDILKLLDKNSNKIKRIVVGLHFYQTHPNFIENFMHNKKVKYIMQSDGTFHPKVYLFYNSETDWSAIIGSPNLTFSAFNKNTEASMLISNNDSDYKMYQELRDSIKSAWKEGYLFDAKKLENYRSCYRYQTKKIKSLSKSPIIMDNGRFETTEFDQWEWEDFCNYIQSAGKTELDIRFRILNIAHQEFKHHERFCDIDESVRRCLAGTKKQTSRYKEISDFLFFGYTYRVKNFNDKIFEINNPLSKAIDIIPQYGEVTEELFTQYCKIFYEEVSSGSLTCATRLLAMKRPDLFVCITGANKKNICRALGIPQSSLKLSSYWELIISRVQKTKWYKDSNNKYGINPDLYRYKVAMLDVLFKEED